MGFTHCTYGYSELHEQHYDKPYGINCDSVRCCCIAKQKEDKDYVITFWFSPK